MRVLILVATMLAWACSGPGRSHDGGGATDAVTDTSRPPDGEPLDAAVDADSPFDASDVESSCPQLPPSRPCGTQLEPVGAPTVVSDARWIAAADLAAQLADRSWVWVAGTRDDTMPGRFTEYHLVRVSADFEMIAAERVLETVPRSDLGREWGAQGLGAFALDPCLGNLLIPLPGIDTDLFAEFTLEGGAIGSFAGDFLSGASVAHDGTAYQVLGSRPRAMSSCDSAAVPVTLAPGSLAESRGAEITRADWAIGTPVWRDGRWRRGGSPVCGTGPVAFIAVRPDGSLDGPILASAVPDTSAPWAASFPVGSSSAVLTSMVVTATGVDTWAAVYDPDTGTPRGPAFVLATIPGRPRAARFFQAEDETTFGWAYADDPPDGSPSSVWLVRFTPDGTVLQRTRVASGRSSLMLWFFRWTGEGYAIGHASPSGNVIDRFQCPE